MITQMFSGKTVDEAKKKLKRWCEAHKPMVIREGGPTKTIRRVDDFAPATLFHIRVDCEL
jgi:hypothetical protein